MSSRIERALVDLIGKVRSHYGSRAGSIYRIDRAANMEETDGSDAEIVVLLADGSWRTLDEQRALGKLTFEALMEHDVYIRAWPIAQAAWEEASLAEHPALVREFRSHARRILVPA